MPEKNKIIMYLDHFFYKSTIFSLQTKIMKKNFRKKSFQSICRISLGMESSRRFRVFSNIYVPAKFLRFQSRTHRPAVWNGWTRIKPTSETFQLQVRCWGQSQSMQRRRARPVSGESNRFRSAKHWSKSRLAPKLWRMEQKCKFVRFCFALLCLAMLLQGVEWKISVGRNDTSVTSFKLRAEGRVGKILQEKS